VPIGENIISIQFHIQRRYSVPYPENILSLPREDIIILNPYPEKDISFIKGYHCQSRCSILNMRSEARTPNAMGR